MDTFLSRQSDGVQIAKNKAVRERAKPAKVLSLLHKCVVFMLNLQCQLESKKDATTSPLRVLLRVPLQREDRFADDRAMSVVSWKHRAVRWPTTTRVEASATLGQGVS